MTQQSEITVTDRRTEKRFPIDQHCWCEGRDITLFGRITNASQRGAFIRTGAQFERGEQARLVWTQPSGERAVIRAEVAWVSDGLSGYEPGLGLRLVQFETGEEWWLSLLVEDGLLEN